jgi:hypothetical protein
MPDTPLRLDAETRTKLWRGLIETIEDYAARLEQGRVAPELDPTKIRSLLKRFDFPTPVDPMEALGFVIGSLREFQAHTPHSDISASSILRRPPWESWPMCLSPLLTRNLPPGVTALSQSRSSGI